jgi:hypothetical protein
MSLGISAATIGTIGSVAGTVGKVVGAANAVGSLFGGGDQPTGGSPTGGGGGSGYYDPYAAERPQFFKGVQTLMGQGGTPGTPGSKNALSYNDWVKANPSQAVGYGRGSGGQSYNIMHSFSQPYQSYNAGLSKADSDKAYQEYVAGLPTGAGTEGVSGNQAAINMVMNSPGYMGGLQQGQRTLNAGLARTGQIGSGAERLALQNYGQDYFNQQYQNLYNQYTGLSMATASPLDMSRQNAINNAAIETNATNRGASAGGFGNAINSIQDAFGSLTNMFDGDSGSSYSPNNYVSGYSDYSPVNTNIGMGGVSGPANMGGGTIGPNWRGI